MFHVKHVIQTFKKQKIDHLLFYIFLFTIPLQLRFILNPDQSYIDYFFSYHKAVFFYLSDLLFVAFVFAYFIYNKEPKRHIWLILLPIIWALLNLFHVEQIGLGLYGTLKILEFWLIIAFIKQNPLTLRPTLWIIVAGGLFQALIGISQFHVQHDLNLAWLGEYVPPLLSDGTATLSTIRGKVLRAYGTMPHPNVYAGFLSISLAFFYYVSRETSSLKGWIIVSCGTFVLWWGLLVSFSRSGWLAALLVTALFIGYTILKKTFKQAIIWGLIAIVSCGTLSLFYKDVVFPRSLDVGVNSQASQYRADFNNYGFDAFKRNILTGVGTNQYIVDMESNVSLKPWQYQPPHNIILLFLAEMGIIGLFVTCFTFYKLGFTWNNQNILTLMIASAVLVLSMLDHYLISIQQGILIFAVCLGLILANKKDVSQVRETSK